MTTHTLLPFARSYWVLPDRLLAGFYPGDRDPAVAEVKLDALLDCGIRHIICLMEQDERDHAGRRFADYAEVFQQRAAARGIAGTWSRHEIRDGSVPTPKDMTSILQTIDAHLADGRGVYVHCWGGKGRTGAVVGCWLARHGIVAGAEVLTKLHALTSHAREHFPRVPETRVQTDLVTEWRAGV